MKDIISNFESLNKDEMSRYAGKWVAVVENKIVVFGESFKEVYDKVKIKFPSKRPLIGRIPESKPLVLTNVK